jgi:predicted dehydrogenase
MLAATRPDFVVALGRHRQMAAIAHDLLDQRYPFLMEKPMGINAREVEAVAAKAAQLNAFVAVPLAQRYGPFATRARELIVGERFGPLSHIYVRINRPGPARYELGIAPGCLIPPRPAAAASATSARTGWTCFST